MGFAEKLDRDTARFCLLEMNSNASICPERLLLLLVFRVELMRNAQREVSKLGCQTNASSNNEGSTRHIKLACASIVCPVKEALLLVIIFMNTPTRGDL